MNPDEFVSITRGLVKRGWTEIEPKVFAGGATGGAFGIILAILSSYHVPITPQLEAWGPYIVAVLGSYLFPSSGQVIVTRTDADSRTTTTKTTGGVETIVTGAIPLQLPKQAPDVPLSQLLKPTPAPDEQATQILPPPIHLGGNS